MTVPTLLLLLLSSVALFTSIFALFAVLRTSDRSLSRQLSALSTRLKEQEATTEELGGQLKAMRAREHMRTYRRRKAGDAETDEDPPADKRDWVRKTNEQLALSRLGVK